MRLRPRKIVKKVQKMVLPGIRRGDRNVDWREVAERLLEQNEELVKEIERLQSLSQWTTMAVDVPVIADDNVPGGRAYMIDKMEIGKIKADIKLYGTSPAVMKIEGTAKI